MCVIKDNNEFSEIDYRNNYCFNLARQNGNYKRINGSQCYKKTITTQEGKIIQIVLSTYVTDLSIWDMFDINPSETTNICIVLTDNSECTINATLSVVYKDFEVIQYVYNCNQLSLNECSNLNLAIQRIPYVGTFIDPLANTDKHAKLYSLKPNQSLEIIN